jgi:hypothetical protein
MTATATIASQSDRLQALERANEIRRARAQLKRRISAGHLSAAQVILDCPPEAQRWPVAGLLACQRHWGSTTCSKFLARSQISETKRIGELTERQRRLLAAELAQCSHDQANFPQPIGSARAGAIREHGDVSMRHNLATVAATGG